MPVQNRLYREIRNERKGFFSEKRNKTYRSNTLTDRSNIGSGADLLISSTNKNIVIQAANLTAGGDLTLDASQGQISLLTAKETEVERIERYKANAVWWVAEQEGFIRESVLHNHITAGGQIYFRANNGVLVEYEDRGDINHAIAELSKAPELAWMAQLRIRNDIEWRAIQPHYEEWYEKQEGLTEGAAAVISLAVAAATGPLGSQFFLGAQAGTQLGVGSTLLSSSLGFTGKTAVTAAIDAGFTALASRATVSLINNKGDIGAVLKELGSAQNLRSLAAAIVTAGVSQGLDTGVFQQASLTSEASSLAAIQNQLVTSAIKGTVNATIRTAIEGGDFEDAIVNALRTAAVSVASAHVHEFIGDLGQFGGLADGHPIKVLLHGAVGGGLSELAGGEFAHGAVAAAAAELSSGFFDFEDPEPGETAVRIVGALTAALLGGDGKDVHIAADIAGSVEKNNRRLHLEEAQKLAELTAGKTAEQKNRYVAAACALVKCSEGVPETDPHFVKLRALQLQGDAYVTEQKDLRATGYFDYGALGGLLLDKRTASAEFIKRGYGILQIGTGSYVIVDSAALGAGACAGSAGTACAFGGAVATIGFVGGGELIRSGFVNFTEDFKSTEGAAVLQSFNADASKHPGFYGTVYDDAFGLGIFAIEALGARAVAKFGPKIFDALKSRVFLDLETFNRLPESGIIDPKNIRFSQNSISKDFRGSFGSVDDLTKGLKNGTIDPSKVDPIRIVEKEGKIFTLDNRRLKAFQDAGVEINYKKIDSIPAKENFKFTTNNDGITIEVRK